MTTSFDLKNRVVIVTGGSKGIGKAIALDFLKAGSRVAVCARSETSLNQFAGQAAHFAQQLLLISVDATQEESVHCAVRQALDTFGGLDVLVNNVGGAIKFGNFFELTKEDWQNAFDLNVQSMVSFSKAAIPYLKKSPFPRIINISSISGVEPGYFNPHYATTKASAINLSKYLANCLAVDQILVNCICPGTVFSDSLVQNILALSKIKGISYEEVHAEFISVEEQKIPLRRIGSGEDISRLALFLASDSANWITGSCFHLNGGKMRAMS